MHQEPKAAGDPEALATKSNLEVWLQDSLKRHQVITQQITLIDQMLTANSVFLKALRENARALNEASG